MLLRLDLLELQFEPQELLFIENIQTPSQPIGILSIDFGNLQPEKSPDSQERPMRLASPI